MALGVTLGGQARKLDEGDWQLKVGVGKSPRKFMHTAVVGSNPCCAKPTNRKERKKPSCIEMNSAHQSQEIKLKYFSFTLFPIYNRQIRDGLEAT
jgi:hypothetical protein